jgi:hypothetical protein
MKTLEIIEAEPKGNSGSSHYADKNIQAVHEALGIPYQAIGEFALLDMLNFSTYGIQVVKFDNGAVCFGILNFESNRPTKQTLIKISKMAGVTRAAYFGKDGSQEWAGLM